MSRSEVYHPRAASAPRHHPHSAAAVSRSIQHRDRGDYTFAHGGRQVRIGPVAFWIVVGTLVIMAGWSVLTGTYFAFSESVLTRLIGRQAEMQFAYEDRIAELRAQVDRITSRQLLDQEQFEQKLNVLIKRQALLEQRTNAISGDPVTTGSIKRSAPEPRPKPSAINDTKYFSAPRDQASNDWREMPISGLRALDQVKSASLEKVLSRVSLALDKVETRQTAALTDMEEQIEGKTRRLRSVLSDLGVDPGKAAARGSGGPYVPMKAPSSSAPAFDRQLYRIHVARAQLDRFTQTLVTVPIRKPVNGDLDTSSNFGVRMDPFLRRPAMHTGLDMRGDTGDPVHATATGKVVTAGREGGYGNMVEIEHGNGLSTRYGHLSAIEVKVGQHVRIGQLIGRVGSTGRSTGPHLHYETRINDEPVDPQKFLRAGMRLGSL